MEIGSLRRRALSASAALAPLLSFFVLLAVYGREERDWLSRAGVCSLLFGLGPLGVLVAYRTPWTVLTTTSIVLWTIYLVAILTSRWGLRPWGWHLFLAMVWCVVGFFCVVYAGLSVT